MSLGANTLENFSNKLRAHTHPTLHPSVEQVTIDRAQIVVVTVQKARPGEVFYAFDGALIRVGKSKAPMSAQEQKARLVQAERDWSEERDRPRFEVIQNGVRSLEREFEPNFKVRQSSGDRVASLEWRMRGPRFAMDWRPASGSSLERTHFVGKFDLSQPALSDDIVGVNEMGFEIRFYWRGRWRSQIHRWGITRRDLGTRVLWDVGQELLPHIEVDDPEGEGH